MLILKIALLALETSILILIEPVVLILIWQSIVLILIEPVVLILILI